MTDKFVAEIRDTQYPNRGPDLELLETDDWSEAVRQVKELSITRGDRWIVRVRYSPGVTSAGFCNGQVILIEGAIKL